ERRPCRDDGGGEIASFLRALIRETALATLVHQRRLTPSCGAERTVGPARMIAESLTPKPGIREQYLPRGDICRAAKTHPLFHTPSAISKQCGAAQSDPAPWGKDAPLGRDIERFVTIVITPILSRRHRCYARI